MSAKSTHGNVVGRPFGKGNPGRPKGAPNKTTRVLKEAVVQAAEAVGADGKGKQGLVGYLTHLARTEPRAFSSLLAKAMPIQLEGGDGGPIQAVARIEIVPLAPK